MDKERKEKAIEVLGMMITDLENDMLELDGMPFNGNTVGEAFGTLSAVVYTLAKIQKEILEA